MQQGKNTGFRLLPSVLKLWSERQELKVDKDHSYSFKKKQQKNPKNQNKTFLVPKIIGLPILLNS